MFRRDGIKDGVFVVTKCCFFGYPCASLHVHMRARVLCVRTGVSARINWDSITIMGIMPITFVVPIMFIMFTFLDKYPH